MFSLPLGRSCYKELQHYLTVLLQISLLFHRPPKMSALLLQDVSAGGVLFQEGKRGYLKFQQVLEFQKTSPTNSFSGAAHLCGCLLCSPSCSGCHVRSLHPWLHPLFLQGGQLLWFLLTIHYFLYTFFHLYPSYFLPLLRESLFPALGTTRCLFLTPMRYDSKVFVIG